MSHRAIPPKVLRELRDLVASLPGDVPNISARRCDALVAAIDAALAPRRSVTLARKRVKAKRATRKEKVSELRARVLERAGGSCEACGDCGAWAGDSLDLDHFHGGKNRRALESFEGCWALCRSCHRQKTANTPFAAYWLRLFLLHCAKHGYAQAATEAHARLESLQIQNRTGEG